LLSNRCTLRHALKAVLIDMKNIACRMIRSFQNTGLVR
jgi:hypothetical protein